VPAIGTATALTYSTASVTFTAPGAYAGVTFTATSSPGGLTATSATSPITVSGLSEQTAYTFTVTATNATGTSGPSAASNSITTPVAFTPEGAYDSLATVTLSAAASSITFSGIPSTYKHLQIRILAKESGTGTGGPNVVASLNSDTTYTNYRSHYLNGNGSAASSGQVQSSGYYCLVGNIATSNASYTSMFGALVVDVLDYANTSKNKTLRCLWGHDRNGTGEVGIDSSLWINTAAAITSITFSVVGGTNFTINSSFALYGAK
jgi:hypothetical protein